MRVIHQGGFPEEERLSYREIIFSNIIESMKSIINAMNDKLKIPFEDEDEINRAAFDLIDSLPEPMECDYNLPTEIASAIKLCWQDEGVKEAYKRRNEYQLNDSAA